MEIREATAADLPRLVELLAQDELGARREDPGESSGERYRAAFDAIDADPDNQVLVGELDGKVACMLQLTFLPHLTHRGGWRAQIEGVRVASEHRGRGLGGQLLAWAVERARERGCHLVQLTTDKARPDAHRFYEAHGFKASHEGMKLHLR